MDKAELNKIMDLYKSHLQVKKMLTPNSISLYLNSIYMFVNFCDRFHNKLAISEKWLIENLGVREIEAFIQHQMTEHNWKRSTMVTCISCIKVFYQFLSESENVKNPIQHFKFPRDFNEIVKQGIEISKINKLFELSFDKSVITSPTTLYGVCQDFGLSKYFFFGQGKLIFSFEANIMNLFLF